MSAQDPEPEIVLLRRQVSQIERLRQEVLDLSHRLDQERARFNTIQHFIRQAVQVDSGDSFPDLVCEAIIELLECGVAACWCLQCEQNEDCLTHSGLGEVSYTQWRALRDWILTNLEAFASRARAGAAVLPLPPLPGELGLQDDFCAELVVDSQGQPVAMLFACNTRHQPGFYQGFPGGVSAVFTTFANQVGVLIESLRRRATIAGQIERIRVSEERLVTALASSNVGLWDWDLSSGRVYYSEQWKRQLGLSEDDVGDLPEEWSGRLHPDERDEALRVAGRCAKRPGTQFEMTLRMLNRDGEWLWINTRGFNISKPNDGIHRMIGTHIDVTKQKILECRLIESERMHRIAKERAEQESFAKSSFLASVSHEIRTPLNGMMAAFQMLGSCEDEGRRRHLLALGEGAGRWMLKIIGESLDIARIEAGRLDLRPEPVDLRAMLGELAGMEEKKARDQGSELDWKVDDAVPRLVLADPVRLRQILANLMGNALKFTRNGTIRVRVSMGRKGASGIQPVRFSVSDTGIGFNREFKNRMFQPFAQAVRKSESGDHGIGLGLVITKELTALMGGAIRAFSRPGVGSYFVVRLPLAETALRNLDVRDVPESRSERFKGRVLLAEDDETSGVLGRMMIESTGLCVDLAMDGGEALAMATEKEYDLIFMDCWMPVMNGVEVTRALRAEPGRKSSRAPIIALTANARSSDQIECMQAGMNGFMAKPLFHGEMIVKIREFIAPV